MKDSIYSYLGKFPLAFELFKIIEEMGDLYLIGGLLREYKDYGKIHELRDIDIVIDVKDKALYEEILAKYNPKRNRFGGFKLSCSGLVIDIWLLKETWAYKKELVNCLVGEFGEKLTDTVFLNIDGIVYDWKKECWYDEKYKEAMKNKVLDVVLEKNPYIELNIVRALILKNRYQLKLSNRLKKIINKQMYLDLCLSQKLYCIQLERYKKEIISRRNIEMELEKIKYDSILGT